MMNRFYNILFVAIGMLGLMGCGRGQHGADGEANEYALPDTLRVGTLYSPASYFIYRDQPMGYDYPLAAELAEEKGMVLDLTVAPSLTHAIEMLDSGLIDLIAYEIPITYESKENMVHCGPVNETSQVLVQPKIRGQELITDVTQLVGRDIYVEGGTRYYHRLINLNEELGGGINIHTVDRDTLITEDLIDMVAQGDIPLTVVDSDIARINKTYYPNLDITMEVSFPQRTSWAVSKQKAWLADSINAWFSQDIPRQENAELLKRYFERSKALSPYENLDFRGGVVSKYDHLFKHYAPQIGWDWRLLAAQSFAESRFNPNVTSWAGARGLMQIMPATARAYKADPAKLSDPETSVEVAVRILASLDKMFRERVPDATERIKFMLAAYNSGPGHVLDAIALAKKYGKNPQVWDGHVAEMILLKANPKYYNDPVVKFGYSRGRETYGYVTKIMDFYTKVKQKISE